MRLYPAIDVKDGQCVRLKKGLFNEVTVYSERPYEIAKGFEEAGAQFIHTVDLDGALKGHGVNAETIKKICSSVNVPVQMGGGIRTLENIQEVLDLGVYRVIIGTKAVENPDFIKAAIDRFGAEHIVVGVDAKDGLVAIEGWEKVSDKTALSLALAMKDIGVQTIVYTDISKDGMLTGPNVEQTLHILMMPVSTVQLSVRQYMKNVLTLRKLLIFLNPEHLTARHQQCLRLIFCLRI